MSLNSLDANTPDKYDIPPYCVLTRITFGRPLLGVLPVIVPFHYAVQYEKFVQSSRILLYLERVYSSGLIDGVLGSDPTRHNLDKKQRKIVHIA